MHENIYTDIVGLIQLKNIINFDLLTTLLYI